MEPRFQGEEVVPGEYFLVSTKLDTFLLSDNANCTVLRVLTQYKRVTDGRTDRRRQTDRQTDENWIASTALAMRALRRAVIKPVANKRKKREKLN